MSARPPTRTGSRPPSADDDDGAAADGRNEPVSLRWARGLWERSIGPERRRPPSLANGVNRSSAEGEPETARRRLLQMRDELGARLLVSDPGTQAVRNLYLVHRELGSEGWASVEMLPRQVTGRAQAEAEMLAMEEPSTLLGQLVEDLRVLNAAADARAEAERIEREWALPVMPEVSEATHEEYELMERSWIGTVPSGLEVPERPR